MDFNRYKNYLLQYLQKKGVQDVHKGLIRCFSPTHDDKHPSCEVSEDRFICYSCGIKGDIYDAVEILTGEKDKAAQYKEVESTFGGSYSMPVIPKKEEKPKQTGIHYPDSQALKKLDLYLQNHPAREAKVLEYFKTRAVRNGAESYPPDVLSNLKKYFYYWPGFDAVAMELGVDTLVNAGIPFNSESGKSAWYYAGVVVKTPVGYKLFAYGYDHGKFGSVKRNPSTGIPCPFPSTLPENTPILLTEGEIDSLSIRAAGIYQNSFSLGGANGLTEEKAAAFFAPKNIPEIILFADKDTEKNDFKGQRAFGLMPLESERATNVPEKLIKNGVKAQIKIAILPADCPYKDADEAILHGRADLVKQAIENAVPYKKQDRLFNDYDSIGIKRLKSLLKKIEYNSLDDDDIIPFASAAYKSCKNSQALPEILRWGQGHLSEKDLEAEKSHTPYFLLEICDKYNISKYMRREIENALIPASEILRHTQAQKTIVPIDYDNKEVQAKLQAFLVSGGVRDAALCVAQVLDGRLIYVENENKHYFFNGHIWTRIPDIAGDVHAILLSLMQNYLKTHFEEKSHVNDMIKFIQSRRFRVELSHDLSGLKPEVFHESVPFDGPQIKESLTLLDGVVEFSGGKEVYRESYPEEYRREILPYKTEDVKNAREPKKFLEFMQGNFKNKDTLNTLLYYLSLIPSRNTGFKYGGIFLGKGGTGKSTTLNIMEAIFQGMTVRIKSDVLVSVGKKYSSGNEATPEIAKMEGKCCAFAQETARNASLNANFWKELTGNDTLTARGLYEKSRDFIPTAQVIIASNYSPNFDGHDDATIDRMVVIPFTVQHKKEEGSKTSDEFIKYLRPEFPAVVKYFIEKYIDLHINLNGKIPMSEECKNYKGLYVEDQRTDLDKFVNDCIAFDMTGGKYTKVQDAYACYLNYYNLGQDSKEALTRNKFVRFLKRDYNEIDYKQKKINGYPELVFFNMVLTEQGLQTLQGSAPKQGELTPAPLTPPPMPEQNPFDTNNFTENDSGEPDIF